MTWLQFLIGTDGMLIVTKQGLLGAIKESMCNLAITTLCTVLLIGLFGLIIWAIRDTLIAHWHDDNSWD